MSTLPTADGRGFDMLDLGANTENTAHHLVDFAILGSYYAENVRGINKPRVALISNGAEESKGSPTVKEAHEILSAMSEINSGALRPTKAAPPAPSVLIKSLSTDKGFLIRAPPILVVTLPAMMADFISFMRTVAVPSIAFKMAFPVKPSVTTTSAPPASKAGGAAFVGLKAPVVKAHGNSSELAIASALKQIHKMLESDVSGKLVEHFEKMDK